MARELPRLLAKVTIIIEGDDGETQTFVAERAHEIELGLRTAVAPGDDSDGEGTFKFKMRPGSDGHHYHGTHWEDEPRWLPEWGRPHGTLAFEGDVAGSTRGTPNLLNYPWAFRVRSNRSGRGA